MLIKVLNDCGKMWVFVSGFLLTSISFDKLVKNDSFLRWLYECS